ncbi:MAG: DUF4864 domain-containing protein [Pseudomonadota bacterium]
MKRIFRLLAIPALIATLAAPLGASAQTADEAAAIEDTIRGQIAAMQNDDWTEAFTYASPTIQRMFENPEKFSRMVTNGYPMVWRPRSYRVGEIVSTPEGLVQTMIFEDQQGRLFIADYQMQLVDGEWRINGVRIRPAPEQTA